SGLNALTLTAGSSLVAPGGVDESLWWIDSGLVRLYSLSDSGVARNHDFIEPGNWAYASLTWKNDELCCDGAALGLEALEDTIALRLPLATLQHWRATSPAVAEWIADEMMRYSSRRMQREASLLQSSAEARYLKFLSDRPGIADRVAQHHIAAWLGITPVGLSRIRARLKDAGTTHRSLDDGKMP
ncbi:MAG: Crp/Fnr family transcriptional regulator, partial [Lysobacter sp.]